MTKLKLALILVVSGTLAIAGTVMAQDTHNHGDKGAHSDATHFKVTPPTDVKAAWAMIVDSMAAAESQPDNVHEAAEKLEVAFHALEEKSSTITGEAKNRLASVLKQADKANDALHHGAEAKDSAKVSAELKKLKALLPLIEAQFPAGALK